ncbi:hypothetical protein MA9V1_182 [Chryseobacterium phage MA9V-1]|nr:hypothetical protein MA9V1_182 [Chryseobacterium phage MA9V-1]
MTSANNNEFLNECVIAAKKFDGHFIIAKNRDRPYDPSLTLIHEIIDGIETVWMVDEDTDWSEGMNEFGISIVNSALMVARDEAEKKTAKKEGKKFLKDGTIIREALKHSDVEKIIDIIISKDGGLKGHTFVCTKDELYAVELTSKHQPEVQNISDSDNEVRTNHGIKHTSAGYQKGLSFKSSAIRKNSAIAQISKANTPEEVLQRMRKRLYKKDSMLNMKRDTKKLWTSSQLMMDPTNLTIKLVAFSDKTQDLKIDNRLPEGYVPKIKLELQVI